MIRLTIGTRPTTKKTSSNVVYKRQPTPKLPTGFCASCRRGSLPIVLPSDNYRVFAAAAVPALRAAWSPRAALEQPVNVAATFYRDALRGDLVGYLQALADVLEEAAVVVNDKWIVSWDGSRLDKDAHRPRVELVITILPQPQPQLVLGVAA